MIDHRYKEVTQPEFRNDNDAVIKYMFFARATQKLLCIQTPSHFQIETVCAITMPQNNIKGPTMSL